MVYSYSEKGLVHKKEIAFTFINESASLVLIHLTNHRKVFSRVVCDQSSTVEFENEGC